MAAEWTMSANLDNCKQTTATSSSVKCCGSNCVFSTMSTLTQTNCEAKKLELMKAVSGSIQNMCSDCISRPEQLNDLYLHLKDNVQLAIPAPFPDRGHFIFERDDFQNLIERTEIVLRFINTVLEMGNRSGVSDLRPLHECLPYLLVILSSNMRNSLWSVDSTRNLTLQVLNQLRILYKVDSLSELLQLDVKSKDQETVTASSCHLGQYLGVVRVRLTKHEWQANPTFVESFVWMLTQMVKFPHMRDYLDAVLPPALLFIDSHVTEQKVVGIQCLQHIAANVTNEQLRWYGRADVIYAALKQQIYSRAPEIIRVLHPALLTVLPIIDRSSAHTISGLPSEPLQVDVVLSTVVTCAVTENGLVLRRLYSQFLPDYIGSLGLHSVRHLKKLVELVCDYLEVCDAPEEQARCNALSILHALLQHAWPRVPSYADQIVKSLLKLLQDLSSESAVSAEHVAQQLCGQACSCLELLIKVCPQVEACLQEVARTPELKDIADKISGVLKY